MAGGSEIQDVPLDQWRASASRMSSRSLRTAIIDIQKVIVQMDFSKPMEPDVRAANEVVLAALLRRQEIMRGILLSRGADKPEDAKEYHKALSDVKIKRAF